MATWAGDGGATPPSPGPSRTRTGEAIPPVRGRWSPPLCGLLGGRSSRRLDPPPRDYRPRSLGRPRFIGLFGGRSRGRPPPGTIAPAPQISGRRRRPPTPPRRHRQETTQHAAQAPNLVHLACGQPSKAVWASTCSLTSLSSSANCSAFFSSRTFWGATGQPSPQSPTSRSGPGVSAPAGRLPALRGAIVHVRRREGFLRVEDVSHASKILAAASRAAPHGWHTSQHCAVPSSLFSALKVKPVRKTSVVPVTRGRCNLRG